MKKLNPKALNEMAEGLKTWLEIMDFCYVN